MKALVALLLSSVAVVGCALFIPKETLYLRSVQDRATQEEVRQRLGAPVLMSSTPAGEALWVYHVREQEPGAQNSWATAGSWCDEYVLTFDKQGILRRWTNRSERHGGETVAIGCVRDGLVDPSNRVPPRSSPYGIGQLQ